MHQEQWGFQSFLRGRISIWEMGLQRCRCEPEDSRLHLGCRASLRHCNGLILYLDQLSASTLTPYGSRLTDLETDLPESRSRYVFFKGISNALEVWLSR